MSELAASPFIKASKEKLLHQCAEEFERLGPLDFPLLLDFTVALCLVGNLQLALRHPANDGPSSSIARDLAEGVIGRMRDAGYRANAEMLTLGFDPAYDHDVLNPSKPQPAPIEMPQPSGKGQQPVNTPQMKAFLKSHAKLSKERDLLLCTVLAIRYIKNSIPFDAAAAATKCIEIAREALAQLSENQRKPDVDPAAIDACLPTEKPR